MLCSAVYTEAHPGLLCSLPLVAAACPPAQSPEGPIPHHFPFLLLDLLFPHKPFRINTCKSVSKQTTLTFFRMNTYEKHRGVGVLLLTTHPTRMRILSERSESIHDSDSVGKDLSLAHQCGLACHAQPCPLFLHPRVGEAAPARVRLPLLN